MKGSTNPSKSGIALIIVLGFLAVLTLMAVSFSIEMRTERIVSSVYVDAGNARHFVDVALARAMTDIDNDLKSAGLNAPDWLYFESNTGVSSTNQKQLYDGEATNYVPRFMDGTPEQSDFILIGDPSENNGPAVGRYAYLVVNQTGLLDINEVGKANRAEGASPGEIQITDDFNPEVSGIWSTFPRDLSNVWRRIETMNEFSAITNVNLQSHVYSMGLYSRSMMEPDPKGRQKYRITDASTLVNDVDQVIDRLEDAGFTPNEAGVIFANLVDFLDEDYVPYGGLTNYCGESVPFINEIIVSNQATKSLAGSTTSILHEVFITIEIWNPFTNNFSFNLEFDATTNVSFPVNLVLPPSSPATPTNWFAAPRTPSQGAEINIGPEGFALVHYRFTNEFVVTPSLLGLGTILNLGGVIQLELIQANNSVVDQLDFSALSPSPLQVQLAVTGLGSAAPGSTTPGLAVASLNVDDPRLNHLPRVLTSSGPGWFLASGPPAANVASPGSINTRSFLAADASGEGLSLQQVLPKLYVRNAPFDDESSAGDVGLLGYIGTGEPWRTIALYDHPMPSLQRDLDPVIDYFGVGPFGPFRGQVSVNTMSTDALASTFVNLPFNTLPGAEVDEDERMDEQEAAQIAEIIFELVEQSGGITNLSVLGSREVLSPQIFQNMLQDYVTDDSREAIIRNSIGLLTVRQNLFAVIVEAHVLGEPDPDTGEQPLVGVSRALAHVWRDPFADANGLHPMYIRNFMYLDENF